MTDPVYKTIDDLDPGTPTGSDRIEVSQGGVARRVTIAQIGAVAGPLPFLPLAGGTLTGPLTGTTATFSGEISAANPALADNDTTVATTKWVKDQGYAGSAGFLPIGGGTLTGNLNGTTAAFSGSVTFPTQAPGVNNTTGATTAYVTAAVAASPAGTVTAVSVVNANGLAATVANPTTTPAITLSTSVSGLLKGNGTTISAAAAGSDYIAGGGAAGGDLSGTYPNPTIKPGTNTQVLTTVGGVAAWATPAAGGSVTAVSVVSANGLAGTVATPNTTPAITLSTTITGLLKGNATAISAAVAGTDYITPATNTVLQTVNVQTGAVATGTTLVPADDTIPQITEGDQYMTLAITPKSATSKLIIEVVWIGSSSVVNNMAVSLFQDATVNALAVSIQATAGSGNITTVPLRHVMTSGTTSATTFRVRAGGNVAGTTSFNGSGGARFYGGALASGIVIQEVAP